MATSHSAITMNDVKDYARIIEKRKKSTTPAEARARLIAYGLLDENGEPHIYPKAAEAKRKSTK